MRPAALLLAAVLVSAPFAGADGPPPAPAGSPSPSATGPRIGVEPAHFDFGRVRAGRTVSKEFVVRNIGRSELVIESITPSCGCTIVRGGEQRRLAPGASTTFVLSLTAPGVTGPIVKTVLIKSNDASRPGLTLTLEAQVTADTPGH